MSQGYTRNNLASGGATSGNLVLLSSQDASASSSISFTSVVNSTYSVYKMFIYGLLLNGGDNNIYLRGSTDNGGTWLSTNIYSHAGQVANTGASGQFCGGGETAVYLSDRMPSSATAAFNAEITLYNLNSTAFYKSLFVDISQSGNIYDDNINAWFSLNGIIGTTTAVNAIQIYPGAGTFTSGKFQIFGRVN